MSDFAENLRRVIFEKRLKAVDVAKATKITPPTISRYLSGTHQPTTQNLIAISKYLEVSPESLLSSSEAPESSGSSRYISSDKDKIIAVQEELVKNLQKRVKELEEALGKKTTPDEVINRLFDLIDQSGSYGAFGLGMGSYDENDENQKWIFSEMERLDAEMKTIRSMFFSEEEIQDSQNANMKRVQLLPPKSPKRGRPLKK